MGYYTEFKLSFVKNGDPNIIKQFREENEDAEYALDDEGNSNKLSKWYDCTDDLRKFSLKYPKTIFLLEGIGEEPGDFWKLYAKNGKTFYSKAEIVFEKFSLKKLK